MAWAGVILGMVAGLCAAVISFAAAGMALWASFLIYAAAGPAVTLLTTALLYWRSEPPGPGPWTDTRRPDAAAA